MIELCGVVVLYNPSEDFVKNIETYIKNLEKLYVIDNSSFSNESLLTSFGDKIIYICNYNNLGLSSALNIGSKLAKKDGYKWILTMDQDSYFVSFPDYINACNDILKSEEKIANFAPKHTHDIEILKNNVSNFEYSYKNMVITSGNILNLDMLDELNYFDEALFIDMIDYDLCCKIVLNDYKIVEFKNLYMIHQLGTIYKRKNLITRKIKEKIEHNPQRVYYKTRNMLYLSKKYSKHFPKDYNFIKIFNILYIHEVSKIILYEGDKYKKLYAKLLAMKDFIFGKLGKVDLR